MLAERWSGQWPTILLQCNHVSLLAAWPALRAGAEAPAFGWTDAEGVHAEGACTLDERWTAAGPAVLPDGWR